jgi:hypothetical protein
MLRMNKIRRIILPRTPAKVDLKTQLSIIFSIFICCGGRGDWGSPGGISIGPFCRRSSSNIGITDVNVVVWAKMFSSLLSCWSLASAMLLKNAQKYWDELLSFWPITLKDIMLRQQNQFSRSFCTRLYRKLKIIVDNSRAVNSGGRGQLPPQTKLYLRFLECHY